MKRSRFSEEQIAYALRLAGSGTPVVDVCRQIGVSEATYYTWKMKFGDLTAEVDSATSVVVSNSMTAPFCARPIPSEQPDGTFSGGVEAPQIYRLFYRQPNFVPVERS
ncbi:transposase family protein [Hydrogenophaga sp. RAC07]|nr:transposase family protein [Hydrogenophaga sp. RAC07]